MDNARAGPLLARTIRRRSLLGQPPLVQNEARVRVEERRLEREAQNGGRFYSPPEPIWTPHLRPYERRGSTCALLLIQGLVGGKRDQMKVIRGVVRFPGILPRTDHP